jgi:GNAT superfamily N-acetyltransferase
MSVTYFKRYRMEVDLAKVDYAACRLPSGFRFVSWDSSLLTTHAETKCQSFRQEIDANVFPCLGDFDGCHRLMAEISRKEGFLPQATWLLAHVPHDDGIDPGSRRLYDPDAVTFCGTVQGVEDRFGMGSIQNLGIVPEYRGRGLGAALLLKALDGFRRFGMRRAYLEVTAQNDGAVRLYRRLGFFKSRTVYKAVELLGAAVR